MRFLTKETWKAPPTADAHALMPDEIAAVTVMREEGVIAAVYTAVDLSSAWIVWSVDSEEDLEQAHQRLPLHPYMMSETLSVLADEM